MATPDTVPLARSNVDHLLRGRELIERLDQAQFAGPEVDGRRGGVGTHLRHVLDHYDCFLRGLESGRVDYDSRERDLDLEQLRARALAKIDAIVAALAALPAAAGKTVLEVWVDCGEPERRSASRSSVARELQFLVSHTIHHYAVIALLLRAQGVEPGRDFGVAPSTLKYEQGAPVCAR